jgi:HD superfamily phosphohydrolase YqeK
MMNDMDSKTQKVVKEAERLLKLQPYDAAHDINHHRSVYKTAQAIAKHSGYPYDPHLLQIACMWHDVVSKKYDEIDHRQVTADTAECVRDYMVKQGFTPAQAEIVYLAVRHHEFDDKPVNIEGKMLFDADKLDNLNLGRVRRFIASDRIGHVPQWKLKAYIKGGVAIIKATRNKLHFDYSKKLFDQIVDDLWDDKEVAHYAKKYDVDLDDIKTALRKKSTILERAVALIRR